MRTPPRRVLVIVTRRIGDVLLATPVIESVAAAWPDAAIDVLVFDGTQGVIAAHPHVRRIHVVPERPGIMQHVVFIGVIVRRYDLALSLVPGDRPTLYAWVAGRSRYGLLLDDPKHAWKQRLLHGWVAFDDLNTHTVRMNLDLVASLKITPRAVVAPSWSAEDEQEIAEHGISKSGTPGWAVLHVYPKFAYKMWRPDGWAVLAADLMARGLRVVLTGGGDPVERAYVEQVARLMPAGLLNLSGQLSLSATACLIARARLYVGPDTAMTHVAAALGVPTVALFGPSNCVKWGPWPQGHPAHTNPWRRCGTQRQRNVMLVQGTGGCVPCHLEGCARNISSASDCLKYLDARRVIAAAASMLEAA